MALELLSEDEIHEATGKVRPTAQARWLRKWGVVVQERADGSLVVLRSHFEEKLGLTRPTEKRRVQLNTSAPL